MSCPQMCLLLRSLSGELPPSERDELDRHLAGCPICRQAYADLRETWGVLGSWAVDVAGTDLTADVLAGVEQPAGGQVAGARWAGGLRVAASIACALGLGITAGALLPTTPASPGPERVPGRAVEGIDVAESLGLTDLGGGSATGLGLDLPVGEVTGGQEASS